MVPEWNTFSLQSSDEDLGNSIYPHNSFEQNKTNDTDQFFSELGSKLCELGLTEKKTDALINLVIRTIEKTNELNESILNDTNGFTPTQVNNVVTFLENIELFNATLHIGFKNVYRIYILEATRLCYSMETE